MSMEPPRIVSDSVLATVLVGAPAWVLWIDELNKLLSSASLIVGLALGIGRLIAFLRERKRQ